MFYGQMGGRLPLRPPPGTATGLLLDYQKSAEYNNLQSCFFRKSCLKSDGSGMPIEYDHQTMELEVGPRPCIAFLGPVLLSIVNNDIVNLL